MSPDLVDHWDKSHERIPKDKDASAYAIEREVKFPRQARVVDIGGGTGADAMYFVGQGHTVTLIDVSNVALTKAQERAAELGFSEALSTYQVELSSQSLPLDDSSADVVYSRLVFHFLSAEQMTANFQEVHRILAEDGVAYITLKSPEDEAEMAFLLQRAILVKPGVYDEGGQLKYRYTKDQIEQMLRDREIPGEVHEYRENLGGRKDTVKSGASEMLLNEVVVTKR